MTANGTPIDMAICSGVKSSGPLELLIRAGWTLASTSIRAQATLIARGARELGALLCENMDVSRENLRSMPHTRASEGRAWLGLPTNDGY